ncbi:hypothetical protein HPB47_002033 [Ixodes persulcatus]|uniref:Uncharacterized protein n=1 Tax=Ixodes persulcatus TaxID=34615 RepID=A0AC60PMR5_IXOPE|nr:hypothetical protein HPB47_002033 [Ixodes persulcatus]
MFHSPGDKDGSVQEAIIEKIPEMDHGTVGGVQKKDRKRFHLKRIRRGKKEAEPGSSSQGKAGSGGKAPLQVEITVSQEAAAAHDISASMDNLADVNRGDSKSQDGSASLSIRDMGYLSCSHPSLAMDSTLTGQASDTTSLVSYCSYDSTGVFRHMEQFLSLAKEVHTGLRTMLRGLQTERERLKQHIESENLPGGGGNAALVANLKNALSQLYQAMNLATKVEILSALKDGVSRQQVMESYDAKRSTLATYVKIEAEILQASESEKFNAKRKRLRKVVHPKLEEALLRWIVSARDVQL